MKSYKVVALQINSGAYWKDNFQNIRKLATKARDLGARLIGLPENFSYFGNDSEKFQRLSEIELQTKDFLSGLAKDLQAYIWGGGYPARANQDHLSKNRASLYSPDGIEIHTYDKIHLFDMQNIGDGSEYQESRSVEAGQSVPSVLYLPELGHLSTAICYDLRFPELFCKLSQEGAEVLFLPAAFTKLTGTAHWEVLLRARAIENTCYVVAPAQTGTHSGKRETFGHAMIIDPWGVVLADAGTEPGFAIAEINPERLREVRERMPSLKHRNQSFFPIP